MKRIQYHHYGGPEEMRLEPFKLPAPAKDEILVRVHASSVNPADWKIRQGAMKIMSGWKLPRAMGTDFSGVVESIGSEVKRFRYGDEVMGTVALKPSGAFAEMLLTKEHLAVKKPMAITHEQASTLPMAGVTAWKALVQKAQLKTGQRVFINGANGGVGQAATHIARALGATVTLRVSPSALARATALGITSVLDYTKEIPSDLRASFDVVFDCNGSLSVNQGNMLVNRRGVVLDINPNQAKFMRSLISPRLKLVFGTQDT